MKRIIVVASSRKDGNSNTIGQYLAKNLQIELIHLQDLNIASYSYTGNYATNDDFTPLLEKLVQYDEWILITPIYWYTMSAQMKTFFDRLTDTYKHRLDLGEALKGIGMRALCCGSSTEEQPHFFDPFRLSADYLEMDYRGDLHTWLGRIPAMKPEVKLILDAYLKELT